MKTHKGYKYRIYPNKLQRHLIESTLGCTRFIYNYFLDLRKRTYAEEHRTLSQFECMRIITQLRHDKEYVWLSSCDSMALQESVKDLNRAYVNFFDKRAGFPRFHRKHDPFQSYRTRNQSDVIRIDGNHVRLPKLGAVKSKISRLPKGRILNATVSRTATGKYFVSLCVEEEMTPKQNMGGELGLDLGIKELYVDSDGHHEPNPKSLSCYEKKLRREQRRLSRRIEANIAGYRVSGNKRYPIWKRPLCECSNIQKQRLVVAKLHEKIRDIRIDNLHKVSSRLVNENQVIAAESLNVRGMVKNHRLAKAISDASWGTFLTMLEYKAFEHGCTIVRIPTFFPSSQVCSSCGHKNPKVKDLSVRRWVCPVCGTVHDRDENAALNILSKGIEMLSASR